MSVRPGIEVLTSDRAPLLHGARVGLLAHPASVGRDLTHTVELLRRAGVRVTRLFAAEHGVAGAHQDMALATEQRDLLTGLPVVSLYGATEAALTPRREDFAGLDVLVADLADVGARYYTFAATVIRALPVAGACSLRVVVADRPNPLGGAAIEGNLVVEGWRSFVGELPVPNRHGLTLGELCLLALRLRRIDVELTVIPADGWRRESSGTTQACPGCSLRPTCRPSRRRWCTRGCVSWREPTSPRVAERRAHSRSPALPGSTRSRS